MLIDIHVHTHKARHPQILRQCNLLCWPTPEQLIATMDEEGIDKAVIHGCVSPEWRWTMVNPEEVMEICAAYPDRLIPFCNVDPRYLMNDETSDFHPILEAYKEMGCKGIGEYFPNLPFDDPRNLKVFEAAEDVGLPLTFHIATAIGGQYGLYDKPGLPLLEKVLGMFPKLIFLAHSPDFWTEISTDAQEPRETYYPTTKVTPGRVVEMMRRYPNLHGDLSGGSGYHAISRDPEFGPRFMEEFQDRLYFGTDIANVPQDLPIVPFFRELRDKRLIPTEVLEKISWKNAASLLSL